MSDLGDGELLTIREAADLLQMSRSSIKSYMRQGLLPAVRAGGRHTLLRRSDVLALLAPIGRGEEATAGGDG